MSQQLQITGGAKVRSLEGVITGSTGVLGSLPINGSNGIPQLDVNGKILVSQLPNSVMEYLGTWNAATNTPTLVNGTGNAGDVYLCNVAGTVNFGAGPITFGVGDQVIYSGTIWQRASGSTGTVTSVAVTETGDALTITGSPITTSGTINIGFAGTSGQYVNGAGGLTTFPTLLSSVGLSMPSAFSVANSPLTANGTIAVTGAGVASQYVRGDGTLANFPTSGGGGGSVSYYLNGSVNQGTFGGNTYYEMNKVPVIGAGTNFSINANGYIAQFITDSGDPALLEIPSGNWNFEMYFNASSNGGTPSFYVELYKYNGSTFTLIASSSAAPEGITNGTAIDLYTTALAVPTTSLTITDRLAVRVYVTHSGRTITLHTENSNLCQVITTFSTGITALNGLTAQVQYFGTGTSGTDFNISSTTATHTFNLPIASATNTGKLSSSDWTTFNNKISGSGTTNYLPKWTGSTALNNSIIYDNGTNIGIGTESPTYKLSVAGTTAISGQLTLGSTITNGTYTYTLPSATGTLAIRSDLDAYVTLATSQVITGAKVFDGSAAFSSTGGVLGIEGGASVYKGLALAKGFPPSIFVAGFSTLYAATGNNNAVFNDNSNTSKLQFQGTSSYTYTFPANTGTVALTSDIPVNSITSVTATSPLFSSGGLTPNITIQVANTSQNGYLSSTDWNTFNGKQNALTNPITGTGSSGRIPYFSGTTTLTSNANLNWDNSNNFITTSGVYVYNTSTNAYILTSNGDNVGTVFNVSATRWGLGYSLSPSTLATAALSWNSEGRVSIGNTNNTYNLDVTGTGRFTGKITSSAGNNSTMLEGIVTTGWINMMRVASTGGDYVSFLENSTGGDRAIGTLPYAGGLCTYTNTALQFGTNNNIRATITGTGNVLIGTTTDNSRKLQVAGGALFTAGDNSGASFNIVANATGQNGVDLNTSYFTGTGFGPLTFTLGGSERMRITSGGNVLISTTTSAASVLKLQVGDGTADTRAYFNPSSQYALAVANSSSNAYYLGVATSGSTSSFQVHNASAGTIPFLITYAGNLGLGTTTPTSYAGANLAIVRNTSSNMGISIDNQYTATASGTASVFLYNGGVLKCRFDYARDLDAGIIGTTASIPMLFFANGSEKMRITSAGNVGIGASSPSANLHLSGFTSGLPATSGSAQRGAYRIANSSNIAFDFGTVAAGQAWIQVSDLNNYASNFSLLLNPNGGAVLVGKTTKSTFTSANPLEITGEFAGYGSFAGIFFQNRLSTNMFGFYGSTNLLVYNQDVGNIASISASTGVYTPLSDINKKKDFEDSQIGLNAILNLKPTLYRMKGEEDTEKHLGFIAQEVKEFIPQAFVQSKDFIGLNYNAIVAALVKSVQELKAEIEELKNK